MNFGLRQRDGTAAHRGQLSASPATSLAMTARISSPAIRALLAPMPATAVRHSPAGFGLLVSRPLDADQTRAWVEPCLSDAAIRQDVARFAQKVDPQDLDAASNRLGDFDGPALLVWGAADRFFKLDFARRLRDTFADGRLVEIENGRTFIPHDEPTRLADEIAAFQPG